MERIDKYLLEDYPELSRSHLQKLIEEGYVTVNGLPVKNNYKVRDTDEIEVMIPPAQDTEIIAEDIPLDILYEDDDLMIVNKPKGMVVHPAPGHYTGTLVNAILFHCENELSGINGEKRPGIVHRIDKDTTGALVICKNDLAHNALAEQLKEHSITRKYRAIVHGRLTEDGTINAPIGRATSDRKKMSTHAKYSRHAVTHYHILRNYRDYTYVECTLETGRTHQIRVHMSSIGHPVLGDAVYGPAKCPVKGLEGQTLHAAVLGFLHPRTGEYMEFEAPLPEYFAGLLDKLEGTAI